MHSEVHADARLYQSLREEAAMLDFYRKRGRKYDVAISVINKADPDELAQAKSEAEADAIMKQANLAMNQSKSRLALSWPDNQIVSPQLEMQSNT